MDTVEPGSRGCGIGPRTPPTDADKDDGFKEFYEQFRDALADDLNMPQALAVLWGVLRSAYGADKKLAFALEADKVLGLDLDRAPAEETLSPELTTLVEERRQARKNKDFKRSDELRKELLEKGVLVEDTPKGMTWKKKTRVIRD